MDWMRMWTMQQNQTTMWIECWLKREQLESLPMTDCRFVAAAVVVAEESNEVDGVTALAE